MYMCVYIWTYCMPLRALIIIFSKQYQDNISIQIYHMYTRR